MNAVSLLADAKDALYCLWQQKTRTLLSMLGMAIGTTALVSMLSIGEGARHEVELQIESLGIDVIRVENQFSNLAQTNDSQLNLATGLTEQDVISIEQTFSGIQVGKYFRQSDIPVSSANGATTTDIYFANPQWLATDKLVVSVGRSITQADMARNNQVCVIGLAFAQRVKARTGTLLNFAQHSCSVIGILAPRGSMLVEGTSLPAIDYDDIVITPLSMSYSSQFGLSAISVKLNTNNTSQIKNFQQALTQLLKRRHKADDFLIVSPLTLLQKADQERRTFSIVMGSIAGLSIIVGGIGVMNAMLAHVAEQTREIGLRLALGATKQRILQFFICQSVIICVLGTLSGVLLGILFSLIVQYNVDWPVYFSLQGLSTGPLISIISGVIFGLYPALKAMQVSPNTALRII